MGEGRGAGGGSKATLCDSLGNDEDRDDDDGDDGDDDDDESIVNHES